MLPMRKRKTVHVVPREQGWAVQQGGATRATRLTSTKAEAQQIARTLARRKKAELVIHGRNGRIQNANSFGSDPHPPHDRKH